MARRVGTSAVPGLVPVGNKAREYRVVATGDIVSKRQYDKLRTNPQLSPQLAKSYKGQGTRAGIKTNESRATARKADTRTTRTSRTLYDQTVNAIYYRNLDVFANKREVQQSDMFRGLWSIMQRISKGLRGKAAWNMVREFIAEWPDIDFSDIDWGSL